MARQLGASATVNSSEEGAAEKIMELTEGGARSIVDFVGAESSVNFGYNSYVCIIRYYRFVG